MKCSYCLKTRTFNLPHTAILGVAVDDQVDAALLPALIWPADGDLTSGGKMFD